MTRLEKAGPITEQALEELAGEGKILVSSHDVALRAMQRSPTTARQLLKNGLSDLFLGGRRFGDKKPSFRFRHLTEIGMMHLEEEGVVDHFYADEEGQLHTRPVPSKREQDHRYRLVPSEERAKRREETAQAETPPRAITLSPPDTLPTTTTSQTVAPETARANIPLDGYGPQVL